ncbi:MAG TPA: SufE family protein [Acidimicrobiia bacterium]|jgi:cysteine desulfuration protein SufE|nr:SufE family protein [Acidimicrobiia bacterium]
MALPERLATIVEVFRSSPKEFRVEALIDFSKRLPPLPPELAAHREELEQVPECQTPFFLASKLEGDRIRLYFDAPPESPTVRGYAGILAAGLDGESAAAILDVDNDFYLNMGLEEVVTPLRLRGMGAIMARLKKQIAALVPG